MSYKEKQFVECSYNPLTTGNMLELYPELRAIVYPVWEDKPELDSLIRYVVMVYDPKSPLYKKEKDLHKRKSAAAELAQFDMESKAGIELLEAIYSCSHPFVVQLTVEFLRKIAKSKEYAAIVAIEYCFWESITKLMQPIIGEDSKKELEAAQKKGIMKDELDKDIARLEKLHTTFFGDDSVMEEKAKGRMTPEMKALEAQGK